jgi:hypothetical protein
MIKQDGKMGIFPLIIDGKPYGAIVAYNHFDKITTKEIEYLIYTDNGVYEISDQLFMLKFNSSDIYSSISIGDTITIKVSGARVHVMSTYPNIISVIHTN